MQEPTLFNYTIKENILYGKSDARDSYIREAATISNALEFIESSQLGLAFDDSAAVLRQAFIDNKEELVKRIGEKDYDSKLIILERLNKKEMDEGKF